MKKISSLALLTVSSMLILASCSNEPAAPSTYNLTFHQTVEGEIDDYVFVVTPGETQQTDAWAIEPDINPKAGYTSVWEEYNVEEMTGDLTVEPIYTPIKYVATFIERDTGDTLGTSKFTVEDTVIQNIPELPTLHGYTYAWEPYTIEPHDMSIYCDKTANEHTIKFFVEDEEGAKTQIGDTQTFTIETESVVEPEIPERSGYDSYWPEYDLTLDQDLEVTAIYTLHHYYVQFVFEGNNVGEPVAYDNDGTTYEDLQKPETPEKTGYTVTWPSSVELTFGEIDNPQIVEGIATANTYTVSYEGSDETTSVTYDAPYELNGTDNILYDWYYQGEIMPLSGDRWNIADDITLTKEFTFLTYKVIDFEDGINKIITNNSGVTSIEVVAEEGLKGSKALKCVFSGEGCLNINKDYLDLVFADPNVKALSFYAKGTLVTNNFRHITVDAQYVNNNNNIISCYEVNGTGHGIDTVYKQFFLTRGVYSQMGASDWAIKYGGADGPHTLYLDNFQPSRYDYYDRTVYGLENGREELNNATTYYLRNPVTGGAQLLITGAFDNTAIGANYDMFTEGERSFAVTKTSGQLNFYLRDEFAYANLPDEGILFDYYADFNANGWWDGQDTGAIVTGTDKPFVSKINESVIGGKWHTFHFTKSQITTDGRFFIIKGSVAGRVYIDNIRIATSDLKTSFEDDKYVTHFGDYVNVTCYDIATTAESNATRDQKMDYMFIFEWNGCDSGEITNEKSSDGAYSLKLQMNGAQCPVRFDPRLIKIMSDTSTISFDVYTDDVTFVNSHFESVQFGVWTTITLAKSEFDAASENRMLKETWCRAGTLYIDNVVVNL